MEPGYYWASYRGAPLEPVEYCKEDDYHYVMMLGDEVGYDPDNFSWGGKLVSP